jgi:imidazolonepropionase
VREGIGVAVRGDKIIAVDSDDSLRRAYPNAEEVDCDRGVLAPGFVDSHTHAVFGAPRWAEHELRATGVPYLEIARRGGGIHSSVRDLRSRTDDDLFNLAGPRLLRLAAGGVTTVEIKSGYGLSKHDELRTLRVIARLAASQAMRVVPTCLAAHEVPLERRDGPNGRREWVNEIVHEIYPAVAAENLARFADVFCEPGVFTLDETRELLEGARAHGMVPKLHADELHDGGGAALGAELRCGSASITWRRSRPRASPLLVHRTPLRRCCPATMLVPCSRKARAGQEVDRGRRGRRPGQRLQSGYGRRCNRFPWCSRWASANCVSRLPRPGSPPP